MQHLVYPFDANRHDRNSQPGRDHPNSRPEAPDDAVAHALTLWEDQDRESAFDDLAHVSKRLARADLALRQRKGVEEEGREIVVEAVRKPFATRVLGRKEMRRK